MIKEYKNNKERSLKFKLACHLDFDTLKDTHCQSQTDRQIERHINRKTDR